MSGKRDRLLSAVVFYIISTILVHSTPMTSQFLGTHNIGNEQVLLFQLPKSISSQVSEQYYPKTAFNTANYISNNERYQPSPKSDSNTQSISLTIPLSPITSDPYNPMQSESMFYGPSLQQARQSDQQMITSARRASHVNQPLIDYLTAEPSQLNEQVAQSIYDNPTQSDQEPQQQPPSQVKQLHYLPVSMNKPLTTSNSQNIEQQMRDLMMKRPSNQLTESSTPSLANESSHLPTSRPEHQAQLWLDTQSAKQQEAQPSGGETSDLVAKLSNSSPDMLLRLRSMLQRAVQNRANLDSKNGTMSYGNLSQSSSADTDEGSQLPQMRPIFAHRQQLIDNGRGLLSRFLVSQNLSSIEEAQIPFVVIAVPRIVSVKKNHLGANQPKIVDSSVQLLNSLYEQRQPKLTTMTNMTQFNNTASGLKLDQIASMLSQTANSNFNKSNSTNNLSPYVYLAANDNGLNFKQQSLSDTTASPQSASVNQHTMAPYARHFSAPLMGNQQVTYSDDTQASYQYAPLLAKLAHQLQAANQSGANNMLEMVPKSQLIYQIIPQLAQQLAGSGKIAFSPRNQTHMESSGYGTKELRLKDEGNFRVQYATSMPQRELSPMLLRKVNQIESQLQNERPAMIRALMSQKYSDQRSDFPTKDEQQQGPDFGGSSEPNPMRDNQLRYQDMASNGSMANHWTESRLRSILQSAADRDSMLASQPSMSSHSQNQNGRSSPLEENIYERLRPLFQRRQEGSLMNINDRSENQANRFNSGQLVRLFERSITGPALKRRQESSLLTRDLRAEIKPQPKMVVMIV